MADNRGRALNGSKANKVATLVFELDGINIVRL